MGLLGDYGRYRVPFEFEGKTIHLKITKYTTFNDVVHTLTSRTGMSNSNMKLYAVFESTWDLERKIAGEVRVLSIWRSWGCETRHFRFVVKHKNNLMIKTLHHSSDEGTESEIDSILSHSYKQADRLRNNADDLGGILTNKGVDLIETPLTSVHNNEARQKLKPSKTSLKRRKLQPGIEKGGKLAILTKYFNDLKIFNRRKHQHQPRDGEMNATEEICSVELIGSSGCTAIETSMTATSANQLERTLSMANCQYYWEKHRDCDTDSEMSEDYLDSEIDTDIESELYVSSTYAFDSMDLDTAFVKSSRDSVSDEGIDVTSVISSELNDAFVAEYRNRNFVDTDDYELSYNVDEFERKITTSHFVRKMFGADDAQSVGSQDEEIDSFMRSRLDSF